ncbi:MAG: adenosylcobinamide-GDP ribazoletransferase [SAR324 cluster bacterium]|nr:adenosylcobinamide-GDP ribazoletransferase [SAR324 cluster bacterium]
MSVTRIHKEIRTFLTALTFYTRIPWPQSVTYSHDLQGPSIVYFPLVGWIVGIAAALIFQLSLLWFPVSVAVGLSMAGTILLTGALHEDGFADCCDGFGAGWEKEQILSIMKDSSIGTYGVLGLIAVLGLKFLVLVEIDPQQLVLTMIAGHSISRFLAVLLLYTHDYIGIQQGSKAKNFIKPLSGKELCLTGIFGCLPLLWIHPVYLVFLLILLAAQQLLGRTFRQKIGGYTGDCLGATQQVTEILFYMLFLAVV